MTALTHKTNKILRDWLPTIVLLLLMLVARSTLADHYLVPTGSMENTLLPGDHVLVNKAAYGWRLPFSTQVVIEGDRPVAGDVVIFDAPQDGTRLVKRVVAVAGDHVELHAGRLLVNGQLLSPDLASHLELIGGKAIELNLSSGGGPEIHELVIPKGEVLVLGDHRGNSRDGRYFGTIPVASLYGRASAVFWRSKGGPTWKKL
jgi:signal peptidase I